jgi:DNA-binding XRE family transcriptional regulator/tetratricopeptide (TPR) repeat protein
VKPKRPLERLRKERERQGWSQAEVAEAIGAADEKVVGRWERGEHTPSLYFQKKLYELFGMTREELFPELFPGDDPPVPPVGMLLPLPSPSPVYDPAIPPAPNQGRELVGRKRLLDILAEQICVRRCVALSGLPGVGKTALAIVLVDHPRVRETFCDGVLWVGLGPRPNVLWHLNRWGKLLGLPVVEAATENALQDRAIELRDAIGTRRMLLVVDDAWEIASALHFKIGGPNCAFLVTTRLPRIALDIAHECVHTVPELSDSTGLILLSQWAPDIMIHDKYAAQELVKEVGGLPLALTLMGKHLYTEAHSGQPRRLQAAITRLHRAKERMIVSTQPSPIDHHTSLPGGTLINLLSVIAVSDMRLDEQARAALRALSVFPPKPNSFSEEAALLVAQAPVEALDALYDAGLLESSGAGRCTLHQTIADYAETHLTEEQASERLVIYCIGFIEKHVANYEALELECHNLLAGLKYAFEHGMHVLFIRGITRFAPFLLARGLYDLALFHLLRARQSQVALSSTDKRSEATTLLYLGKLMDLKGDYNQAEVYLRDGLILAREGGYRDLSMQSLTLLSSVARRRGDQALQEACSQELRLLTDFDEH